MVTVSIIIINFNSGMMLKRCLESISAQTFQGYEVIIIDNASIDDSLLGVENYPKVRILRNDHNLGFATGQNQGIAIANGDLIMPLNFDIKMDKFFLEEMVQAITQNARVGSVCGKLLRMTSEWLETDQIDSTGLHMQVPGKAECRGQGEIDQGQYDDNLQVLGALGAAPLYKREMLEDICYQGQYFDEKYFMWYEDVDLDWRAYLKGWDSIYVPNAVAYHIGHPELRTDSFYVMTTIRNRWMLVLTNLTLKDLMEFWWKMFREEIALLLYLIRINALSDYKRAIFSALRLLPDIYSKRRFVQKHAVRNSINAFLSPN